MLECLDAIQAMDHEGRYEAYRELQAEAPLFRTVVNNVPVGVVTRYADVDAILKSPSALVQRMPGAWPAHIGSGAASIFYKLSLPHMDRPDHNHYRKIVTSAFNPATVSKMAGWVGTIVEEHIAALDGREEVDIVAALARTIPSDVACTLLHIPRDLGLVMLSRVTDLNPIVSQAEITPEILERADDAAQFYLDYFIEHVSMINGLPDDDMLSILIRAEHEGRWTKEALAITLIGLFIASYHTTMTSIGNAVHALAVHPEARAAIVADLARAENAWDEMLRYDGPVHFVHRYATEPMTISGIDVEPGTRLLLGLAAANRDASFFPGADRYDIDRKAQRHLAFAVGAHFCLGAQLARLEGKLILRGLVSRYPDFALAAPVERVTELTFPHITSMMVRLGQRADVVSA